jgi:hypothetical protein
VSAASKLSAISAAISLPPTARERLVLALNDDQVSGCAI